MFTKTSKTAPADEVAKNAQLLIRAGFVYKVMAGVYAYTPLGLRVIDNIKQIVREEMNSIGGQELIMTALQKKDVWDSTGRWDDEAVDIWFKTKLKDETEIGLAWSHEEAIIDMLKQYVNSYKDLPIYVYQFQTKFRNELRSKSGIIRGREFLMKDMYSCCVDKERHDEFYDQAIQAYNRVFNRLGIGDDTFVTFAPGGSFTKFSHEFQTICDAGEDTIYINREKGIAINEEVMTDDNLKNLGISRQELEKVKSAEVGNIFCFGVDKSEKMNFSFVDSQDNKQFVYLGSYGIGISRVMGVLVEKFADEKGIVWPESIAPAKVFLVGIGSEEAIQTPQKLYDELTGMDIQVLLDDRDARPGEKFADSELMGIPYRVTVSDRLLADDTFEIVVRKTGEKLILTHDQLVDKLG